MGAITTLRTAIYNALNGNLTYTVHQMPPSNADDYVLLGEIKFEWDGAQSWRHYKCFAEIMIISRYQKTGNREDNVLLADEIETIMRPTVNSYITVPGFCVAGCWLDEQSDEIRNEGAGKYSATRMVYFFNIIEE